MKNSYLLFALLLLFSISIFAQSESKKEKASSKEFKKFPDTLKYKRNVIKWNLTPFLLWSKKDINISYERVLSPYRSFSVNAGYFELPSLANGLFDSINMTNTRNKSGFTVSGDYRFYFRKRNTRMAPDGLYWGVYSSFHHYQFKNDIAVINSPDIQGNLLFGGKLNIMALGIELGYQFVVWDRLTIDLIFMGPSISIYNYKLTLDGDISVDSENEYLQAIYDILIARYPGLIELMGEGVVDKNGISTSFGYGLRYMIQIGYRF